MFLVGFLMGMAAGICLAVVVRMFKDLSHEDRQT